MPGVSVNSQNMMNFGKKKNKKQRKKGKEKDLSLYPTINQYEMMKGEG